MFADINLIEIQEAGLIVTTQDKIILKNYLSSNYSEILKPEYNPHKRPLSVIESHGFRYNSGTSEIEVDQNAIIKLDLSLDKLARSQSLTDIPKTQEIYPYTYSFIYPTRCLKH